MNVFTMRRSSFRALVIMLCAVCLILVVHNIPISDVLRKLSIVSNVGVKNFKNSVLKNPCYTFSADPKYMYSKISMISILLVSQGYSLFDGSSLGSAEIRKANPYVPFCKCNQGSCSYD
jgi:hypothetical protein